MISDAIFHIEGSPNFGDDNSMIMDIEPQSVQMNSNDSSQNEFHIE